MIKMKDILIFEDDVFGKVVLGDPNSSLGIELAKLQSGKPEPNTPFEDDLKLNLGRWVWESTDSISNWLWDNRAIFRRASSKFSKILKPDTPNGTTLYRGLENISPNLQSKLTSIDKSKFSKTMLGSKQFWRCEIPIKYTPRKKVQSWSSSLDIAKTFTLSGHGVLLETTQNDNFMFSQKAMYIINSHVTQKAGVDMETFDTNESETLHFGQRYKDPVNVLVGEYYAKTIGLI